MSATTADHPVIVWLTIGVTALGIATLGYGRLRDFLRERTNARVADLTESVEHLQREVTSLRTAQDAMLTRDAERDRLIRAHMVWEQRLLIEVARLDPDILTRVGEPPSLYPGVP